MLLSQIKLSRKDTRKRHVISHWATVHVKAVQEVLKKAMSVGLLFKILSTLAVLCPNSAALDGK